MKAEEIKALFNRFWPAAYKIEGVACWNTRKMQNKTRTANEIKKNNVLSLLK